MKTFDSARASRLREGFTLLELMVSTALIGLVMAVLLATTSTSLNLWKTSEDKIAVNREGRGALALMADDLRNLADVPGIPYEFANPGSAGNFMSFFVLKPQDYQDAGAGNVGDVCFVQYRFEDNAIERAFVESQATFEAIEGGGLPDVPDSSFELLATNVRSLSVNTYQADGTLNAQGSSPTNVALVSVAVELLSAQEMENIRLNEGLAGVLIGKEDQDERGSRQYFQLSVAVPPPR